VDRDIEALITQESDKIMETYKLEYFQISSGSGITATSTVRVRFNERVFEEAACGDGPVDATFKAIDRATGMDIKLEDYFIKAATGGKDALGEVTVKISKDDMKFVGYGVSTDVVEASAKAYVSAVNRMVFRFDELNKERVKVLKVAERNNYFGEGVGDNWGFELLQENLHL
jgi:2-isopropylmalate synthase